MISGTFNLNKKENSSFEARIFWTSELETTKVGSTLTLYFQVRRIVGTGDNTSTYSGYFSVKDCNTLTVVNPRKDLITSKGVTINTIWVTIFKETVFVPYASKSETPKLYVDTWFIGDAHKDEFWNFDSTLGVMELEYYTVFAAITDATNFDDEDNPILYYNNPLGDKVTSLQACIADELGATVYVPYRSISKTGSSYTFSLTTAERTTLRKAATGNSLTVRFYLSCVVNGTTNRVFLKKTMSIVNGKPIVNPVVLDVNDLTSALTRYAENTFIKGHNTLQYWTSATAVKEATIVKTTVSCGALRSSSANGTFENIESNLIVFTVTDSRGNTTTETINLNIIDYHKVTCRQKVTLIKDDSIPGETAKVRVEITGAFCDVNFGAEANSLRIEINHTDNDGYEIGWLDLTGAGLAPTIRDGQFTFTFTSTGFDVSGDYTFWCRATDLLTSYTTEPYTVSFTPVFDWSATDFNFNVPLSIEGYPLADYVVDYGTEPMGSNGTWYWTKWFSGKAECHGIRNFGRVNINETWGNLYESNVEYVQSYPTGLFVDAPYSVSMTIQAASAGALLEAGAVTPNATETGAFYFVRPTATILEYSYVSFAVVGRWK